MKFICSAHLSFFYVVSIAPAFFKTDFEQA